MKHGYSVGGRLIGEAGEWQGGGKKQARDTSSGGVTDSGWWEA